MLAVPHCRGALKRKLSGGARGRQKFSRKKAPKVVS